MIHGGGVNLALMFEASSPNYNKSVLSHIKKSVHVLRRLILDKIRTISISAESTGEANN